MLVLRYIPSRRSSRRASASREALVARSHRQSSAAETRILELAMCHRLGMHVPGAEIFARCGRPAAEVRIKHGQVHVRKARAGAQRSKAATIEVVETDLAEAPAVPPIPRMESVARSQRQPANPAPAAETE